MSLAAGSRGAYEVVAPIGAGGMGEVYRARDTRLSRDVAIKVLPALLARDPDRRESLRARLESGAVPPRKAAEYAAQPENLFLTPRSCSRVETAARCSSSATSRCLVA
jgi:serine/threonine protein kinase